MARFLIASAALLAFGSAEAQQRYDFDAICLFDGAYLGGGVYGTEPSAEALDAVEWIVQHTGAAQNFVVFAANVPNAAAAMIEGRRHVLYNPEFMSRVAERGRTDWAAVGIMAHEVGHHLSGHTEDQLGSRPPSELEADRFAGYVMYRLGATLDEAQSGFLTLPANASASHPGRADRIVAVTDGWLEAQGQVSLERQREEIEPPSYRRVELVLREATVSQRRPNGTNWDEKLGGGLFDTITGSISNPPDPRAVVFADGREVCTTASGASDAFAVRWEHSCPFGATPDTRIEIRIYDWDPLVSEEIGFWRGTLDQLERSGGTLRFGSVLTFSYAVSR